MSIVTQPNLLSGAFAYDGDKNIIPANNDGTSGLASIAKGFPPITQQPLASGGIPPQRADFNGIFNLITSFLTYIQSGGVFAYSSTLDYDVNSIVKSGNSIYQCIKQNGPATNNGVQGTDNNAYWQLILNASNLLNANVTVSDNRAPTSDSAQLQTMLSSLAYMIKAITGQSDWKSSPAINIATLISRLSTGSDVSWSGSKFTNAKLGISGLMAQNGYIQFGPNFGGLIVQWGYDSQNNSAGNIASYNITIPLSTSQVFSYAIGSSGDDLTNIQSISGNTMVVKTFRSLQTDEKYWVKRPFHYIIVCK